MKKYNITHKINENEDIIFELHDIMAILFDIGKQQFAIHLLHAFDETGIVTDEVFNYTKFKKVDKSRIQRTRGVGNHAMRVYYDLEDILADYESTQIVTMNELEAKRRQEVVELAEKMYTMLEIENFKYYLCNNGSCAFESEELMRLTFVRAGTFINKKHQYLKEGKLC